MVKIQVTEEDIQKGVANLGDRCPNYLAIRRACPDIPYIHVTYEKVYLSNTPIRLLTPTTSDYQAVVFLPDNINAWITAFDNGRDVEPIEYELDLPC